MVYSLPILWKKNFSYAPHIKNTPLWIFVSYKPLKGDQAGVSLDFDQLWVGEVLCQIWCFIQNLHYALKIFVVMLLNITPCCSRLRLRIAYFIYFKFTRVSLIVYQSLYCQFNVSVKETNCSISKGMCVLLFDVLMDVLQ